VVAAFDRWVFSIAGLASFAGWNALVIACFAVIALSPDGALAPRRHKPVGVWLSSDRRIPY
jgi:hypothetical protein